MTDSAPDQSSKKRAVVLLSGGLDSATVLAMAKQQGYQCHALSFIYGQRHDVELRAAIALQQKMNAASHRIIEIDLRGLGGSALTDDIEVPKDRGDDEISGGIPITYVPARNTIFLSYALAAAEVTQSEKIFIGVNSVDYSGYPDCRPEYVNAFQTMANLATKAGVEGRGVTIEAPLISLTKPQIIEAGLALGVDYGLTHSCYDPQVIQPWDYKKYMQSGGDILSTGPGNQLGVKPCGRCDSCLLRQKAFRQLNMSDPAIPSV